MNTFALISVALLGLVTVDHDTTINADNPPIPGQQYNVVGDATLTIEEGILGKVVLEDTASLVMKGGELRSTTYVYGDNNLQLLGGWHKGTVVGTGNANIYIGDGFGLQDGSFNFTGGRQHFEVHGFREGGFSPVIISNGSETTADLYAESLFYQTMAGHDLLAGLFCWEGSCGSVTMRNVNWNLYDINERLEGDSDGNGTVDLADLNQVRNNFGRTPYGSGLQEGDTVPMDGAIDLADLNRVLNNFGASNPVPEPDGFTMVLVGLALSIALGALFAEFKHG